MSVFLFRQKDLAKHVHGRTYREKSFSGGTCTMLRSMWSGVTGLKTHQLEMDVIGNNIANVNTTAYKSQATGFSDILYQTVRNGSAAGQNTGATNTSQVGLGAKVSSIYTNISAQGSAVLTDNVFDLMITGESFFCISPDRNSNTVNFTRDGSFTIDKEGNLVTQNNGFYVVGTMGSGGIGNTVRAPLSLINDSTKTIAGTATPEAYFKGNIDSRDTMLEEGRAISLDVYGSDGKTYTLNFTLTDGADDEDYTFNLGLKNITKSDGTKITPAGFYDIPLVYNEHTGKLSTANGKESGKVTYNFLGEASMIGPIEVDFNHTTNYAGQSSHQSTLNAYKGNDKGQNTGYASGEMTGLSISVDGSINASYNNGQTVKIAQIAVAEFNNAMGLEKVGDNLYRASTNSGQPQYMDVTKNGGYMQSGVLEGSNIDLAREFTNMITTQRGFQANSKVITTSDEMLQILHGLKR